ncbi:hypothetical protein [Micromonospora sp. KLBMP9576]|uniref:hypothetical protein n=1 Tax=Micromonospora sp. KLBMP9576 TaxID=3424769 RepID=UPI003D93903A
MAGIMLRSTAFNDHDMLPTRFSKEGGNVSPPLELPGAPRADEVHRLLVERDVASGTMVGTYSR